MTTQDILEDQNKTHETVITVVNEHITAMIKAGVHIGRIPSKTSPKMAPFMYGPRGVTAIFDLQKTKEKLDEAEAFIKKLVSENKTILFAGTKPAARKFIQKIGDEFGYPTVKDRWIGGTLTNSKNISGRVQRLEQLLREKAEGGFQKYTKKEIMKKEEEIKHLEDTFGGLRSLKRLPNALVLADIDENNLAVREARRMKIPIIAITNSNTDPNTITYPIPANDNSTPSLRYIFGRIENAIQEGKKMASVAERQVAKQQVTEQTEQPEK
ncbi:MAG: 30S ribosomal protein S2 [Patescibacteria group bacterium]